MRQARQFTILTKKADHGYNYLEVKEEL